MRALHVLILAVLAGWPAAAGAQTAEKIFVNGKIVTVDDRFTIAQALAVRGQRIMAVGENGEIDKHSHWIRAAEHNELRFDGVTSRQQEVKMLAELVRGTAPGEWIVVLGGWSEEQFTDEPRGFPRDELDAIAPANPVVLQAVYNHSYLNSAALVAARIDAETPDPPGGKIEKDA